MNIHISSLVLSLLLITTSCTVQRTYPTEVTEWEKAKHRSQVRIMTDTGAVYAMCLDNPADGNQGYDQLFFVDSQAAEKLWRKQQENGRPIISSGFVKGGRWYFTKRHDSLFEKEPPPDEWPITRVSEPLSHVHLRGLVQLTWDSGVEWFGLLIDRKGDAHPETQFRFTGKKEDFDRLWQRMLETYPLYVDVSPTQGHVTKVTISDQVAQTE